MNLCANLGNIHWKCNRFVYVPHAVYKRLTFNSFARNGWFLFLSFHIRSIWDANTVSPNNVEADELWLATVSVGGLPLANRLLHIRSIGQQKRWQPHWIWFFVNSRPRPICIGELRGRLQMYLRSRLSSESFRYHLRIQVFSFIYFAGRSKVR